MKYAIVIPDGCADEPQPSLGGKTPLQAAHKPNMDRIARLGVVGRTNNVPSSLTPASDVATLSLFGYDPLEVYTGRAPLETAAMGISLGPHDWAIRCNLITVENERMRDFTAGHISCADGKALIESVQQKLGGRLRDSSLKAPTASLEFHPGVSYRNILVYRCNQLAPLTSETRTQPPHDIPDQPIADHLPRGPGSSVLCELMRDSRELFRDHPVNQARRTRGEPPATQIWLWGQGRAPHLRPFAEVYGKRSAIISAVDLVRGVGVLLGWERIDVVGATGYLDTDYAAKGQAAVAALNSQELVCVHVEAPDEASHEGRADAKVEAIEKIDRLIVGPLLNGLRAYTEWRILVCPDHRTTLRTRAHAHGPVPFALAGSSISFHGQPAYDETVPPACGWDFAKGHELMGRLLSSADPEHQPEREPENSD
jgi:2,3-bisphosphoglycerate-independent phosphoglycerate mutase